MGEIKFIAGLVMAALFVIAITTYAFNFASDNDAAVSLEDEDSFVVAEAEVTANTSNWAVEDMGGASESFEQTTLEAGSEIMEEGSTFKIGLKSLLSTITSTLSLVRTHIFGGSGAFNIFLSAIAGLLLYTGIRYVYKTWVGKNPD